MQSCDRSDMGLVDNLISEISSSPGSGNAVAWGGIAGDLVEQTDLLAALNEKQALDGDLTAIASISTNGILQRTASDTWSTLDPVSQTDKLPISNGTNFTLQYPQNQNTTLIMRQLMGSPIIADTMDFLGTTGIPTLVDRQVTFQAIYIPFPALATGIILYLHAAGVFTGDASNEIGLYSYDSGTLNRVAITANNENIWKTANYSQVPFISPVTINRGLYFIGFIYNNSAQTTAPRMRGYEAGGAGFPPILGESGNMQFSRALSGQTSLPTSIGANITDLPTTTNQLYYMGLY